VRGIGWSNDREAQSCQKPDPGAPSGAARLGWGGHGGPANQTGLTVGLLTLSLYLFS